MYKFVLQLHIGFSFKEKRYTNVDVFFFLKKPRKCVSRKQKLSFSLNALVFHLPADHKKEANQANRVHCTAAHKHIFLCTVLVIQKEKSQIPNKYDETQRKKGFENFSSFVITKAQSTHSFHYNRHSLEAFWLYFLKSICTNLLWLCAMKEITL